MQKLFGFSGFRWQAAILAAALLNISVTEPHCAWCADSTQTAATSASTVIPEEIVAEALRLQLPLSSIKQQDNQWVACIANSGLSESCFVLGKVLPQKPIAASPSTVRQLDNLRMGDALQIQQYGQPLREVTLSQAANGSRGSSNEISQVGRFVFSNTKSFSFQLTPGAEARVSVRGHGEQKMIDTLPRYRRESPFVVRTKDFQLVRDYIDAHPSEPFLVLVTVPALCEPCRQMDHVIHQALATNQAKSAGIKTFILEYFAFIDAEREVLGRGALFPTTLVYDSVLQPRRAVLRTIGGTNSLYSDELSRTLCSKLKRGAPHTACRGLISKDVLLELIRAK